jgi:hypothetical protein
LDQAPQAVREVYTRWFINQPRDFILLLQFCQQFQVSHQRLLDMAIYVSGICPNNITAEKIMALLGNQPLTQTPCQKEETCGEIEAFSNLQLEEISQLMTIKLEEVA